MKVKTTIVYQYNEEAYKQKKRLIIHQGGSRASKTYNTCIWLISKAATEWDGFVIDIVRKSFPSLRASVMFDFLKILNDMGIYSEKKHNKTENTYYIGTCTFRFFSCDDPQKMRGPGRDVLFCNEINELTLEDFTQLNIRTKLFTIGDFNPSDEFHWIYDKLLTRPDCAFYKTTFLDNPFLPKAMVDEIKQLKDLDANYWKVYGLGERGVSEATIYKNWELTDMEEPEGEVFYGLDFGFNHPTVLVKNVIFDGGVWIKEEIYKSHLTNQDIIDLLKDREIKKSDYIYGDNARPENIEEIFRAGYNIHPTVKGPGSVKIGIDHVKRQKLYITKDSINLIKELKMYKWKVDKNGRTLDEPVKIHDDACFIAETKITTKRGDINIEKLSTKDYILTRQGFKPVNYLIKRKNKQIWEVTLSNGVKIYATSGHPFYILNKGFIKVCNLHKDYKCESIINNRWHKKKSSLITKLIIYLKEIDILNVQVLGYIEIFGNIIKEKYRKIIIFITKIAIHLITPLIILNSSINQNIFHFIPKNGGLIITKEEKNIWITSVHSQRSGINPKKEENGINNTEKIHGKLDNLLKKVVTCVKKYMKISQDVKFPNFVQTNVNLNGEGNPDWIISQKNVNCVKKNIHKTNIQNKDFVHIVAVKKTIIKQNVYNLNVKEIHEYYANGILVSNCDALRYSFNSKIGVQEMTVDDDMDGIF